MLTAKTGKTNIGARKSTSSGGLSSRSSSTWGGGSFNS